MSEKCANARYLFELQGELNDLAANRMDELPDGFESDPKYWVETLQVSNMGDASDDVGRIRLSCPNYLIGVVIDGGRVLPDSNVKSCHLQPGEVCPLANQTKVFEAAYPEFPREALLGDRE